MIERVLGIFLPVLVVVVVGYGYARRVKPDMTWVNRVSMQVLANHRADIGQPHRRNGIPQIAARQRNFEVELAQPVS